MAVDLRLGLNVTNVANTSGPLGEALRHERKKGTFHQCGQNVQLFEFPPTITFLCLSSAVVMMGVSWKYRELI